MRASLRPWLRASLPPAKPSAPARLCGLILSSACALLCACASSGPSLLTTFAETAKENYELAKLEFVDKDYESALAYADHVRVRYPFSRYSVESELLAARAQFEAGEYLAAQDAFRQFSRLHPTHKHARDGWADYMVIVSSYMSMPDSQWPLPPHYQLDQSGLRQSLLDTEHFLSRYPSSPMYPNAIKLRDDMLRKLLEHELYVARFYLDRQQPRSAIGRLKLAHAEYPNVGMNAEIQFLLGVTYLRMDEIELARETFTELRTQHPKEPKGKQAQVYLNYIYNTYGPPNPKRPRPPQDSQKPKPPLKLKKGSLGPWDQRGLPAKPKPKPEQKLEPAKNAPQGTQAAPAKKLPATKPARSSKSKAPAKSPSSGKSRQNPPQAGSSGSSGPAQPAIPNSP